MKRKSFQHRQVSFPAPFVRPIANHQPNLARPFPVSRPPGIRAKKIFVIKQSSRPFDFRSGQALAAPNAARKKIRHILIFDDHPDSLRLVFGRRANPSGRRVNPHVHLSAPPRASSWELILVSMLTVGALVAMFWPLF
jgi:hypothetical protein